MKGSMRGPNAAQLRYEMCISGYWERGFAGLIFDLKIRFPSVNRCEGAVETVVGISL